MDEQNQTHKDRGIGNRPEIFHIVVTDTTTGKLKEIKEFNTKTGKETKVNKNAKIYKEIERKFKV